VKYTVGFCVVSCSAVGSVVVYCELQWDISGLYSGLCITLLAVGFSKGVLQTHSGFLCGFLFCYEFSSGLLRVAVRPFWVIQWALYNVTCCGFQQGSS